LWDDGGGRDEGPDQPVPQGEGMDFLTQEVGGVVLNAARTHFPKIPAIPVSIKLLEIIENIS
jgi:hypothetical protein